MSWADQQLSRESDEEKARRYHEEKAVREARIKDQRGPMLFRDLTVYLSEQVRQYNTGKKAQILIIEGDMQAHVDSGSRDIRIKRSDGTRRPLTISYSPVSHIVEWECGAGKGTFLLRVREDGTVYFETPYHAHMSIEEIGDELLAKFHD
jgi:hypothetical protein